MIISSSTTGEFTSGFGDAKCDDRTTAEQGKAKQIAYVSACQRVCRDQNADNWPKDERKNLDKYK